MTEVYEKVATTLKDKAPLSKALLSEIDNSKAMAKYLSSRDLNLDHWRQLILSIYEAELSDMFHDVGQHFLKDEVDKKTNSKTEDQEKRIMLINTIATYYLIQASKATEKSKRDELFGEVMTCTSKSDAISMLQSSLFVLKGFYLFCQGTFDQAVNYFDNGREYHPKKQGVTAYIGLACVEFCKREYRKALKLLKAAYRINPKTPHLKIALGHCFYSLNKNKLALKAFEYVLETDPNSAEAYLGIALVHKNRGHYDAYLENLEKAFRLKRDHVNTLLELAEHYLYKEELEKAKKLAFYGLRLLNKSPTILVEKSKPTKLRMDYYEVKSRLNYVIASCFHQTQNYENALKHYNLATAQYPNNFQAQFGLGQILINERNWPEALVCFEYIVKNCTDTDVGECYRMLGYLYSKKNLKDEALQYYEKAIKFDNRDYECMLEYASYLENIDPDKALALYTNAVKIIKQHNSQMSEKEIFLYPEIQLNIAVLRHKKGELNEAHEELKNLLEPVARLFEETGNEKYKAMRHTIMYNIAIVLEEKGAIFDAINLYNQLLEENPLYLDASMRLSYIALAQGQVRKAETLCQQLIDKIEVMLKTTKIERLKSKLPEVLCLQGHIFHQTGIFNRAISSFAQVRTKHSYDDPYSKLAQATVYYDMSLGLRSQPPDQKKYLKTIVEISRGILAVEDSNFFAAMMIGIALAEYGRLSEAKEIFGLLMESCSHNKNVMLNIALLEILNKRYDLAIATFVNYLSKKSNVCCDPNTEMCLALCYFKTRRYKEAKRTLQKLILKYPEDLTYRYNLCAVYHEEAFEVLKQEKRQIENTREGIKNLKMINRQLDFISQSIKSKISRFRDDTQEGKTLKEKEYDRIRELSSEKTFMTNTNFDSLMERLRHDEEAQRKREQLEEEKKNKNRIKEENEKKKKREQELVRQRERELEEKARRMMEEAKEAQSTLKEKESKKEEQKRKRAEMQAKKEKDNKDGGKKRRKPKGDMENFITDEEEEGEYKLADEDEDRDYYDEGYAELNEEEGEGEEAEGNEDDDDGMRKLKKMKSKEERKKLKHLKKKRDYDEGEEENEEAPPQEEEEEEEPQPQKKRKLVKMKQRAVGSDEEGDNEFNYGEEQNEEEKKEGSEGGMEEEQQEKKSDEGEPEEPPLEKEEEEEENREKEASEGKESAPKEKNNDDEDEEHYF